MPQARYLLDLTRLLSRVRHAAPTGVDRVEMRYASGLKERLGDQLAYAARHPLGRMGLLSSSAAERFLEETRDQWACGRPVNTGQAITRLSRLNIGWPETGPRTLFISAAHANLHRRPRIRSLKRRLGSDLLALLHDLIPVTHPEYARPGGAAIHAKRLETLRQEAALVLTNSAHTRRALRTHWEGKPAPRCEAVPLGIDEPAQAAPEDRPRAYFLCVGTIEPRKNHLLLLHVWRRLAETRGAAEMPELVLVGRRGWENEQVVDMLERAPAIRAHVTELGAVGEQRLAGLYRGCRALLMPSFVEGFGLPVAEALSCGAPALVSDLPAHREAGGDAAIYLDPLAGTDWLREIEHLARKPKTSANGRALPSWDAHLDKVLALAETVLRSEAEGE